MDVETAPRTHVAAAEPAVGGKSDPRAGAFPIGATALYGDNNLRDSRNNADSLISDTSAVPPEMTTSFPELCEQQPAQDTAAASNVGRRNGPRTFENPSARDAHVPMLEDKDKKKFRKKTLAVVCCILVLVAVVGGVIFAVTSEKATLTPSTMAPTSRASESARLELLRDVLMHLSPDPSVLEDPTTPQYSALLWLADVDEAVIDVADTRRLEVRYALAALYYATNGDNWFRNLGFLSSQHECQWFVEKEVVDDTDGNITLFDGIACDEDDEVVLIKLDGNGLVGSIPPEQKTMSSLRSLNLASNIEKVPGVSSRPGLVASTIFAAITEQLGEELNELNLSDNLFDGPIPTSLGTLSNLEILALDRNKFTGTIPTELSLLSNMAELDLSDNQLTGNIENIVENLPNLTILEAYVNDLTISADLRFPPSLSWLNLAGNHLEGSRLTSNISRLSHLKSLGLSEMNLEGTIPTELGMISDLERLALNSNPQLGGRFPWNSIMNATALRFLRIDSCDLTGQLPSDIGRFSSLEILDVGSNFLEGSIPESIGDMTSLSVLVARQNFLTGTLPSTIGLLTSMSTLVLTWNELEGTLPTEMVNLTSLAILALEGNDFTGGDLEFFCGREDEEFINAVATVDSSANINCSCCQMFGGIL